MGPPRKPTGGKAPGPYERLYNTTVGIDAERSNDPSKTDEDIIGLRAVMERLRGLFLEHGIGIARVENTGDGWLAFVDASTETVQVLSVVVDHFEPTLSDHNESCPEGQRLRLRVVVHDGKVAVDEQGAAGHVPGYAARLLNSSKLRQCLRLTTAPLVVCVSDQVHRDDVLQQPSRLPDGLSFVGVHISEPDKGFEAQAWVHAPGDVDFLARMARHEAASAHALAARAAQLGPTVRGRRLARGELAGKLAELLGQAVRAPEESGRLVALVGKPGVGKHALVERVLADEALQSEFPGGISLVELGNQPDERDLVAAQLHILEQLHEPLHPVIVDLDAGRERLRQALSGRKHLVILDKLHHREHLAAFPVPDACALLAISDHERNLPSGALLLPVPPLGATEARRALAASAAAGSPAELPAAAATVAEACGKLPMGIDVAGTLVAHGGIDWADLAAELRARARPRGRRGAELLLMGVVGASARRLPLLARACLWELGMFDGCFPVPRQVVERLWRRHGLTNEDARSFLDLLLQRALVRAEPADAVRMHDLLVRHAADEMAALGSSTSLRELHGWMADSYLADWGGLDAGLDRLNLESRLSPDDRYGLQHVAVHLDRASRTEQVHRLFELPTRGTGFEVCRWHEVHTQTGELASFHADLGLAYRRAVEARTTAAHDTERMLAFAELQARYDILRALLDANGVPAAEDLATAAELGVLLRSRALSWIDQLPDPATRAKASMTFIRSCRHTLGGRR